MHQTHIMQYTPTESDYQYLLDSKAEHEMFLAFHDCDHSRHCTFCFQSEQALKGINLALAEYESMVEFSGLELETVSEKSALNKTNYAQRN